MAEFWRTGRAPEDDGMLVDARAALRWALSQAPQLPVMLIGYSFGAAAAVQLLSDGDDDDDDDDDDNKNIAAAVLIAPTLCQHDFSPAARPRTPPLLVIYSDNDFATPRTFTEKWLATVDAASRCIAGGDHFFRDREGDVCDVCAAFARSALRRSEATCR
jgi:alpha/beta superfamily hydrolase